MVRTIHEVSKRPKKAITHQLEKLISKYGEKEVRLVTLKILQSKSEKRKLEEEIESKEKELQRLKRRDLK